MSFLVDAGRENETAQYLVGSSFFDLENLIEPADRLFIVSASQGSFWLTVTGKTAAALKSLLNIVPLFYDEGGQALLERLRANTELIKLDVERNATIYRYKGRIS